MPISRDQIENALSMYIDDNVALESDITKGEMIQVKKHFDKMYGQLELEASEDVDEDAEEDNKV